MSEEAVTSAAESTSAHPETIAAAHPADGYRVPTDTEGSAVGLRDCAGAGFDAADDSVGVDAATAGGAVAELPVTVFLPSVDDERLLAWVYLSRVVQGPCAALSALIEQIGVVEAARAVRECDLPESLRGPTERRRGIDCAERDVNAMARLGGRVITPDDPEWPAWRLLGLSQLDPGRDKDASTPLVLWARGPLSLLGSSEQALAVVGSRCSTGYGELVTGQITGDLAARGWTIVSGAAFGVDGAAHRAALASGAPTIAVLACGVDRPYPAAHAQLLAEIADAGLVLSEYPPGVAARKEHFLARNRLIAALADGVLVVEAGLRSGARNTVKWARRLGRPALAVPGPVTSSTSVGCHRMIREGEALLVSRAEEIIDEAGPLRLSLPGDPRPSPGDSLSGVEALIYAALPAIGSRLPMELVQQCDLEPASVRAVLAALELAGLVGSDHSGWFRIASRAGP
ncbi:DNA-processing protein DprA [Nocardia sp. NEAU-G5]|uniref:DNA-processing protein DprA n=1 Tax=Nocardia albiluteola TaxID=2842303 RepID=A0ABS6B298_9NOCA|nr:DNA-processing protein DprA [Nocardia albiluteola]